MNRIKELRKKSKISQVMLADMLHVHQTAISQWETERTEPDYSNIRKMADIFHVSIDYLLGRDESAQPAAQGSELDRELTDMIKNLSDGDLQRVKDFVTGLKSAREGQSSPQK